MSGNGSDFESIVLDTNILYRDPLIAQPGMKSLFARLNRAGYKLFVPELVVDELVNQFYRLSRHKDYKNFVKEWSRVTGREAGVALEALGLSSNYENQLRARYEELGITLIPYPETTHKEVVRRIGRLESPFKEDSKEKGYKDFLIVCSIKDYFNESPGIYFATDNIKDFCQSDGSGNFQAEYNLSFSARVLTHSELKSLAPPPPVVGAKDAVVELITKSDSIFWRQSLGWRWPTIEAGRLVKATGPVPDTSAKVTLGRSKNFTAAYLASVSKIEDGLVQAEIQFDLVADGFLLTDRTQNPSPILLSNPLSLRVQCTLTLAEDMSRVAQASFHFPEIYKVKSIQIPLFSDISLTNSRDVLGITILVLNPDLSPSRVQTFPQAAKANPGDYVTWEWNLQKVTPESWFAGEAGEPVYAFSSAAGFAGLTFEPIGHFSPRMALDS